MKICYLSDATNYHTKKWCGFFRDRGHDVLCISLRSGEIPGVKVYAFDETELRQRSDVSKITYLKNISKIKKILSEEKPDILHAHYATSYGLLAAVTGYHPVILSVWGSDVYKFPNKSFLHRKILEFNLRRADLVFSTSRDMARVTRQYTDKDIEITPFGVDLNLFRKDAVEKTGFTVGAFKSLEKIYGMDDLIRAFALFSKVHPDESLALFIAGQGSQEKPLKDLAHELGVADRVTFSGQLSQEQVLEAYRFVDVAVIPSWPDSESFGVAAVEAQACEIPVIATRVGGLPEVVVDGETGFLVEPQNPSAIAEALEVLYGDETLRAKMGRSGREFVAAHYDVEKNFGDVETIYKNLVFETRR